MEKICGIYKITNLINGKIYIGSSINIYRRWKEHLYELKNNKHCNSHLQRAWNKYKEDNFKFEIIEQIDNIKEKEQFWLDILEPYGNNGYNICKNTNGYAFGYKLSKNINKKEIVQLTLDGEFIKHWDSIREASIFLQINEGYICMCCQEKARSAGNFLWLYKENYNFNDRIKYERLFNSGRKIIQLDLHYNLIKEWNNACIASKELQISFSGIYGCCNKDSNSYKNSRWLYKEDYINNNYNKCYKNKKAKYVLQFSLDGILIKEFENGKEIEEELSGLKWSSIRAVCNGTTKTHKHKGFIWIYKEDYYHTEGLKVV